MRPVVSRLLLLVGTVVAGCAEPVGMPVGEASVVVTPGNWLLVEDGAQHRFEVTVRAANGDLVLAPEVIWEVATAEVATVDEEGRVTASAPGTTRVFARSMGQVGSADLEVYLPAEPGEFLPGTPYFGRLDYVEYVPGTLPLVISAPHGGVLQPGEIQNRSAGVTVTDSQTEPTIRAVREAFLAAFGLAPHVVISHLRRTKLDPNREIVEAAEGDPYAELAWSEYHGFIDRAKEEAEDRLGWALYLDLHGHGHSQQRLELGYLLSASALAADDNTLASLLPQASVADLARRTEVSFPELIRGSSSLGSLLQDRNVRAVPSSAEPNPAGEPYFSGGYSTARHGSRDGGAVSGIQLELHWEGLRDSAENRAAFAERLVAAVDSFLVVHEGAGWSGGPASP